MEREREKEKKKERSRETDCVGVYLQLSETSGTECVF